MIISHNVKTEQDADYCIPAVEEKRKEKINEALEGATLKEVCDIAEYIIKQAYTKTVWTPSQS